MGNAAGKDLENGDDGPSVRPDGDGGFPPYSNHFRRAHSLDSVGSTPPESPGSFRPPLMFAPQVTIYPYHLLSSMAALFWFNLLGSGGFCEGCRWCDGWEQRILLNCWFFSVLNHYFFLGGGVTHWLG